MSEQSSTTHVLIVDDDPVMGELLDALLTIDGYRVTRALSGDDALQVIRESADQPDVILCDMQMPGMHGSDLAKSLVSARSAGTLPASTVFLAMSGSAPRSDDSHAFDAFLRKPFAISDFTAAVTQARAQTGLDPRAPADTPSVERTTNLPPLDDTIFEQLRSKVGSEPLRQLYDMTLEDVRARIDRIAAAAAQGDAVTTRHEAHTIKGSCGMVGALELQALAAATEGGSPVDTSALADFDSACQRLQRMLNEKL